MARAFFVEHAPQIFAPHAPRAVPANGRFVQRLTPTNFGEMSPRRSTLAPHRDRVRKATLALLANHAAINGKAHPVHEAVLSDQEDDRLGNHFRSRHSASRNRLTHFIKVTFN